MKQNLILKRIEHFTEEEKLALFNVEELESRLEMAAIAAEATQNGNCNNTCNQGCASINEACW